MLAAVPGKVDLALATALTSHRPEAVSKALEHFVAHGLATAGAKGWAVNKNVRLHLLSDGALAPAELARWRREVGCALMSRKRFRAARGVLSASAYVFRRLGEALEEARSEVERARAHLLTNDPKAARIALNAAQVPIAVLGALEVQARWADISADLAALEGDSVAESEFLALAQGLYEAAGDPRAGRLRTTPVAAEFVGEE
ncbi:hypothetical protein GCM10022247_35540 [Allokutzneria multivorans]|uniref:Uncharacterized protein n=2 Tax=Allokutzneria multivorans TaxID=1142134 RepID=A0ABP7SD75_9PSEU